MKETVKSSGCGLQFLLVGGDSVLSINAILWPINGTILLSRSETYDAILFHILSMEMTQLSL